MAERRDRPIRTLLGELNRRAREGFRHASFKLVFWVGVVLCGGLGVWFEVWHLAKHLVLNHPETPAGPYHALRVAIATFFPAIVGATSLQMSLEENLKSHRAVGTCLVIVFLLLLFPIMDPDVLDWAGILLGTAASAVSLWVWCAANGLSASYRDPPDAAVGDLDLDATLTGTGDLAGLKH